jgi:MFS family permease
MEESRTEEKGCFRTKLSLLWMNLSSEPLIAIYSLMPFIMRKELGASMFEIALFTTLSPVLSVFSFYWGAWLTHRKNKLLPNLIGAWILARIPFLFFPFITSFWMMFLSCAIYQLFSRASTPALMEILKRNIPKKTRERIFSLYYVLSVLEGVLIGLLLLEVLDISNNNWRMLFLLCALISITSVFLQLKIKIPKEEEPAELPKQGLIRPLKESFQLLKTRRDFAIFQWGFMIGGFALMLIAPARSIFAADFLPVSLADMTLARCVFVGLGMAGSSLIWNKALELFGIQRLTSWILIGFGIFPIFLLLSYVHISWFYLAHLYYGIAQGGSHLVWHLSGTIFAGDQNSTPYTTINVLMIGLRGAVGPILGGLLCDSMGPVPVLVAGAFIGLFGGWLMTRWQRAENIA